MLTRIVAPCFNDWDSLRQLLFELELLVTPESTYRVVVVDDGSTIAISIDRREALAGSSGILLTLNTNLGHQRAIAIGLSYVEEHCAGDFVVGIDSDGEDRPSNVPILTEVAIAHRDCIVLARRTDRAESTKFRIFYLPYKLIFRVLTGHNLDFGNFQIIPFSQVKRLTHSGELWNHFPATVMRSKIVLFKVPTSRSKRYFGSSHMNFVSLVNHGFNAVAVFLDIVFIRLLVFFGALVAIVVTVITLISLFAVADNYSKTWSPIGLLGLLSIALIQAIFTILATGFLFIGEIVLGVGAGTRTLANLHARKARKWLEFEPDPVLTPKLSESLDSITSQHVTTQEGEIDSADPNLRFSSRIHAHVLEHVEIDETELQKAAGRHLSGGLLFVMTPVHNSIYSELDRSVGHFQRYSKKNRHRLKSPNTDLVLARYLDSVGRFASTANSFLPHSNRLSERQIAFSDNKLIPLSQAFDRFLKFRLGKSRLIVWKHR